MPPLSPMLADLRSKLNQPRELEQLYQSDPEAFKQAFDRIFPEISHMPVAQFWNERLLFEMSSSSGDVLVDEDAEINRGMSENVVADHNHGSDSDSTSNSITTNTPPIVPASGNSLTQIDTNSIINETPPIAPASGKSTDRDGAGYQDRPAPDALSWGTREDWIVIVLASLVAGFLANIPNLFGLDPEEFYPRNISFLVLPFIAIYLGWKLSLPVRTGWILAGMGAVAFLYINLLPDVTVNDGGVLAAIHLPLLLWAAVGFVYVHKRPGEAARRLGFLGFNAEVVVMSGLLVISGGIFSGITVGLFDMIGINLLDYLGEYFILWVLPAVPLVATWLVMSNPRLVSMVSPVIARVFTPLALVMLLFYLAAMLMSARDPYQDREFLLVFNLVLIGVMALIVFSVPELVRRQSEGIRAGVVVLFLLAVVTLVVNSVALSAILFRIVEFGITPNRLAVTGANILMLVHLLTVSQSLWRSVGESTLIGVVQHRMAWFLPIYVIWVAIVVLVFPWM
jgi:hypothetical protein